jgi:flavin-dependent dehydrogenase
LRLHDVLIAGAGPAGAATALFLARAGVDAVLVERSTRQARRPPELLPPRADMLLRALGLECALTDCAARPALGMQRVWGGAWATEDFVAHPGSQAWFVDRCSFDLALRRQACAAGAKFHAGRAVLGVERSEGAWTAELSDGAMVRARLLVDATGRGAGLARRLGARRSFTDKLVARVTSGGGRRGWLDVEAGAFGWRYWIDGAARVEIGAGPRATRSGISLAASSTCLDRAAGWFWIAVGDAAAAFDPIASQGLSQAIASAREASAAIERGWCGDAEHVRPYCVQVRATWLHSERLRHEIYGAEHRWPHAPFWRARADAAKRLAALSAPVGESGADSF